MKSNKADIQSLLNSINFVHKQLKYNSNLNVSIIRNLIYSIQDNNDKLLNNRNILLQHAMKITDWIQI